MGIEVTVAIALVLSSISLVVSMAALGKSKAIDKDPDKVVFRVYDNAKSRGKR